MIKYPLLISVAEKMMSSQTVKAEDLFDSSNIPFFAFNSNDEFVEVSKEEFAACEELDEEAWTANFRIERRKKRNSAPMEFSFTLSFLTHICIDDGIPRYYILKEKNIMQMRPPIIKVFATFMEEYANRKEK